MKTVDVRIYSYKLIEMLFIMLLILYVFMFNRNMREVLFLDRRSDSQGCVVVREVLTEQENIPEFIEQRLMFLCKHARSRWDI